MSTAAVSEPSRKQFRLMDSATFAKSRFNPQWLINSMLVQNQPAVVGGPKKAMKTSLVVDMAISLGSGQPFLGRFQVPTPSRVAIFSGESGEFALQETAHRVCRAKGIKLRDCDVQWGFRLPKLGSRQSLQSLGNTLHDMEAKIVFIDPLYLCLHGGKESISASNLYDVGPILAAATNTCLRAGATPIFVHHATKRSAKKDADIPLELDDLSFAGIGEFVRQWVLVNRRAVYQPGSGRHPLVMSVGGSVGHSSYWDVDIYEGCLKDDFKGRQWIVEVASRRIGKPIDAVPGFDG